MLVDVAADRSSWFVVIHGTEVNFGIDVAYVQNVVARQDWSGPPPVRLEALWSGQSSASLSSDRLVVVQKAHHLGAIVAPRLSYRSIAPEQITALPWMVGYDKAAAVVSGIVFPPSEAPLIVLDPEAVMTSTPDTGESTESRQVSS